MCQAIRTTTTVTSTAAAIAKYRPRTAGSRLVENRPDLQADEGERHHVDQEDHRLPHGVRRDAQARRNPLGRGPRHRHRVTHHGQHAGQTNPVRQYPDAEGGDELENDCRRHVPHAIVQTQGDPPENRSDDNAANHAEQEGRRHSSDRKALSRNSTNREPIDQQRAGIVQQALALEDREDALWWFQLPKHRGGRGRIRRCDHGAERDRGRPWQGGHQRASDDGDRDGREAHREDDQPCHRRPVVPEVPRRRVVRRVEQHGRDEERQRELGQHGERRSARNEREDRAAEREKHGIGRAHPTRNGGQDRGREDETDEDFELSHSQRATTVVRFEASGSSEMAMCPILCRHA